MRIEKLYRARDGMLLGVCLGFARWRNLPVALVRIAYLAFMFMTGLFPAICLYILAALLMEPEPRLRDNWRDDDFYDRLRKRAY